MVENDLAKLAKGFGAQPLKSAFDRLLKLNKKDAIKYRKIEDTTRIFPPSQKKYYFAPIIVWRSGQRKIIPMRYEAVPAKGLYVDKGWDFFNARRNKLQSSKYWKDMFKKHHGIVVLNRFFEWVKVSNLINAGIVTLDEVKVQFQKQADGRKKRWFKAGKAKLWKPTATEQKDPMRRQIEINFEPSDHGYIISPVIFSETPNLDGGTLHAFSLITDEPQPEVRAAGHDRSPISLDAEAIDDWIQPEGQSAQQLDAILDRQHKVMYGHGLVKAA